jgi:hypothetical protein
MPQPSFSRLWRARLLTEEFAIFRLSAPHVLCRMMQT